MKVKQFNQIFKPCVITPFDNLKGTVVGLSQSKYGTELQISYYINGDHRTEWFYDFDIEMDEKNES